MDETKPVPLTVTGSMDAQGNVTVWDNGPQAPVPGPDGTVTDAAKAQYDAELAAWKASGGLPKPSIMAAADANHAISVDPGRYSLEPLGVDAAAVSDKINEIRERRDAAKKAAQDRLDAADLAADRKQAIAAVMADHSAAAAAKRAEDLEARRASGQTPGRVIPPEFGLQRPRPTPPEPPTTVPPPPDPPESV